MPKEALVLIIIAGTMLPILVFVTLAVRRVSRPLVKADAVDGVEWHLGMMALQGRKYRLCVRYEVTFEGTEDDFGIVADYRCSTPQGEIRERAGVGSVVPPERDRYIGTSYSNSYTGVMGSSRQKSTFVLATLGPFEHPAELTATGTLHLSHGVTLVRAEVYFA